MRRRYRWRRRGQFEGDALPAEAADAEQDAAEDGEQEIRGGLIWLVRDISIKMADISRVSVEVCLLSITSQYLLQVETDCVRVTCWRRVP